MSREEQEKRTQEARGERRVPRGELLGLGQAESWWIRTERLREWLPVVRDFIELLECDPECTEIQACDRVGIGCTYGHLRQVDIR